MCSICINNISAQNKIVYKMFQERYSTEFSGNLIFLFISCTIYVFIQTDMLFIKLPYQSKAFRKERIADMTNGVSNVLGECKKRKIFGGKVSDFLGSIKKTLCGSWNTFPMPALINLPCFSENPTTMPPCQRKIYSRKFVTEENKLYDQLNDNNE